MSNYVSLTTSGLNNNKKKKKMNFSNIYYPEEKQYKQTYFSGIFYLLDILL